MTDPIKIYVKKRNFRVHVTLPEHSTVSRVSTATYNWVDSDGNQMVDSDGNNLIFNSGHNSYPRVVGVKKRNFRVHTQVKHG